MISRLDAQSTQFLWNLERNRQRMERAEREISSGKRISIPSDRPDQIGSLLESKAELAMASQLRANLGRLKTETDTASGALAEAAKLVEQVRVAGARGANESTTAQQRQILAGQVADIMDQLVGIANTSVEGRHLFSGDTDQVAAYSIDWTQANPVSAYLGSVSTRQAQHPNGTMFQVAHTANQIFDNAGAGKSVFQALDTLRQALFADDVTAVRASMPDVLTASDHLAGELAWYGAQQMRVSSGIDFAYQAEARLKIQISMLEDADIAESAVALKNGQLQNEVALAARAKTEKRSLFDYLG